MTFNVLCSSCGTILFKCSGVIKTLNTKDSEKVLSRMFINLENYMVRDTHDPIESYIKCPNCGRLEWIEDIIDLEEIVEEDD